MGWVLRVCTYIDLDNSINARPGSVQDSLDVFADLLRFLTDSSLDQVPGGVGGDLAGHEDLAVCTDSMGLL